MQWALDDGGGRTNILCEKVSSLLSIPFFLPCFLVTQIISTEKHLAVVASSQTVEACCPHCGQILTRLHSSYQRHPQDLPVSGQQVRLLCMTWDNLRQRLAKGLVSVLRILTAKTANIQNQTNRLQTTRKQFAVVLSGPLNYKLVTSQAC